MWNLVICSAFAGSELSFGYEQSIHAWSTIRGLRLTGGIGVTPAVSVGLTAAVHPRMDRTVEGLLLEEQAPQVALAISPVRGRALAWGRVTPLRSEHGLWRSDLGLDVGFGLVHTVDDLEALLAEDDPAARANERQWSPATSLGVSGTIWRGATGLRLRLEHDAYEERVFDGTFEAQVTWVGVDVVVGFSR